MTAEGHSESLRSDLGWCYELAKNKVTCLSCVRKSTPLDDAPYMRAYSNGCVTPLVFQRFHPLIAASFVAISGANGDTLLAVGFINGSFETGTTDVGHVVNIPDWSSVDTSGATIPFANFITDGRDWGAQNRRATDGSWFLQVNNFSGDVPPASTRFFQDVVTVPGVEYHISFDFQMAMPEPAGYYWSVSWNGVEMIRNEGQPAWPWHEFSVDVVAASELSRFAVDYAAHNWYQFDNFKMSSQSAVPEPQQITVCMGVCLGVYAINRRRNMSARGRLGTAHMDGGSSG